MYPRIVHIETGTNLYGGPKQVLYLLKGLQGRRFGKNILICHRNSHLHLLLKGDLKVYGENTWGDMDVGLFIRLLSIFKKERPHLVHIHSRRGADLWGWLASRLMGLPLIITRRVDNPEPPTWARIKYNRCNRVVVISEGIKRVLLKQGVDENRIIRIPSAVDIEEYGKKCNREWFLREFGLTPHNRAIGMIAQFIPRKGHDILLKVVPLIVERHPETIFLLFGKGPLQGEVRDNIRRQGLESQVKICGFREDMPRVLPCLYAIIHPAYMEGLGVSLLQGCAAGVPVVASRVGGIPEVVIHEKNGILVRAGDWRGFGEAINRLLEDSRLRDQMGTWGKAFVKGHFSIDSMVEAYIDLYNEIIGDVR